MKKKYDYKLSLIKSHKLLSLDDIEKAIERTKDIDELYGGISLGIFMPILEEMVKENHKEREGRRCNSCGLIEGCNCWAGVR